MSWTHRRFCAFDGRAVARFSYPPSRWLSKHLPPREAACDAFALDRVHVGRADDSCSQRTCGGGSGSTYRRLVPLTGRAATCLLTPLLSGCLSTFPPTMTPPCVALTSTCILFAALRACWSRRSEVDVRALRALGGARRQAESDALGAGDAKVATSLRPYADVARASVASSRCSFRASPFGMCSSPVPALLSRCFCDTAT